MLKGISDDVMKELRLHRTGEPYPKAALDKANQQLEAYGKGKTGTFSLIVSEIRESSGNNIVIMSKATNERLFGKSVDVVQGFIFEDSQKPQVAKIKPGDRITATGVPWANLSGLSDRYELGFWLDKATLK
jgi:hypothetical protein